MPYRTQLISPPAVEPISLATAKNFLKVDDVITQDDLLITALISVARRYVETATRQSLITQTWLLTADTFIDILHEHNYTWLMFLQTGSLYLPRPPLQSVTYINYLQPIGTYVSWDPNNFIVSTGIPGRVGCLYGQIYPILSRMPQNDQVMIEYVTGYGDDGSTVPDNFIHAMLMIIMHLYENRSTNTESKLNDVPFGVDALLSAGGFWGSYA